MTDLVNTWLGGQPNYGVQLTFGSVSTGTWVEWTSSEGAAAEHAQLILE